MKILKLILFSFFCVGVTFSQSYQKTALGIQTKAQHVNIEIQFYSPEIVRILKFPEGTAVSKNSLSVVMQPDKPDVKVLAEGSNITLTSSKIRIVLNSQTGKITFYDSNGNLLVTEKDYGVQFTPVMDVGQKSFTVRQAFMLEGDEAIYGLGQHQKGTMNQRLQKLFLRQDNMQICIPFFQSVKGYGLYWDNYSPTTFTDNLQETSFDSEIGDCADYYFMYGGNADGVVAQMRTLTGQAPMFPYWTYGFWQSRERYRSQYETVGVLKKYRSLKIPIDGIVQDWQYWGENDSLWNSTEFGNPRFPNPKAMIDSIHQLNGHCIISVWPSFGPKTKIYKELKDKNMLINITTWPPKSGDRPYDVYNPEARDIYWKYMNQNIFSLGMDGWWLDSTEPDHFDVKDQDFNNKTYLGSFRKVRNAFPIMTVGGVYENQRKVTSDKRVFILTRSAFAGQQRYGATNWSGDVQSRWDVFHNQISGGLNLSLSGIPYWNTDIGGFFPSGKFPKGVKDTAYHELYVRWLQFGTFSTMMRSHGEYTPREIYQFGSKGYWAFDIQEKFINLRYRLLPYIYSASWDITKNSSTMLRALVMDFALDKKVHDINNEYMFGKSFLVCPVTEPLYVHKNNGKTIVTLDVIKKQTVYLPKGADWFDFWTGDKLSGGQEIQRDVPLEILPLYVKAGSIIPFGPFVQYANEKPLDKLEIRIYPGANGSFVLYEDERDNYNYEKGAYSTIEFSWNDAEKQLMIGTRNGKFDGMLSTRTFHVVVINKNNGIGANSPAKFNKEIKYNGMQKIVKF
jgi:alpha-D-xyloside xylohydrolase